MRKKAKKRSQPQITLATVIDEIDQEIEQLRTETAEHVDLPAPEVAAAYIAVRRAALATARLVEAARRVAHDSDQEIIDKITYVRLVGRVYQMLPVMEQVPGEHYPPQRSQPAPWEVGWARGPSALQAAWAFSDWARDRSWRALADVSGGVDPEGAQRLPTRLLEQDLTRNGSIDQWLARAMNALQDEDYDRYPPPHPLAVGGLPDRMDVLADQLDRELRQAMKYAEHTSASVDQAIAELDEVDRAMIVLLDEHGCYGEGRLRPQQIMEVWAGQPRPSLDTAKRHGRRLQEVGLLANDYHGSGGRGKPGYYLTSLGRRIAQKLHR